MYHWNTFIQNIILNKCLNLANKSYKDGYLILLSAQILNCTTQKIMIAFTQLQLTDQKSMIYTIN